MNSIDNIPKNLSTNSTLFLGDSGWSDPSIGTWDPKLRIGTLNTDLTSPIEIINDNITLDGNSHRVSQSDNGVMVSEKNDITIKNIIFEVHFNDIIMTSLNNSQILNNVSFNSEGGIFLNKYSNTTVSGNFYNGNKLLVGLNLFSCNDIMLTLNFINHARDFGIILESCTNITSIKNIINNCNYSILSESGANNIISFNIIENSFFGVQIKGTTNCTINNNLLDKSKYTSIYLESSKFSSINNNSCENSEDCIKIINCLECSIKYNLLKDSSNGIDIINSSKNTICDNQIL